MTTDITPTTTDLRLTIRGLSRADADKLADALASLLARDLNGSLTLTDHGRTPDGLTVLTGRRKVV